MEHKIIENENWERQLDITVDKSEIQGHFDRAYEEAKPHIAHKGFRKGQVPINFIKKLHGKEIEQDALGDIANELFNKVFQEKKFTFIGEPKLYNIDNKDNNYTFSFKYEVMPEFELADYQDINIDEPIHSVTDEEIAKEIEDIAVNNGKLTPTFQIEDELHVAHVKIQEIDEASGLPLVDTKSEETDIFLHSSYIAPDLKSALLNLKVNDNFNYTPSETDPTAPAKTFNISIISINKLIPVEMTDEFVKEYSQGKFSTLDELKEELGFKLQEKWDEKSRQAMEEQIVKKLVDANEFDCPKGLLFKIVEGMTEDLKKQYADIPHFQEVTAEQMYNDLEPSAIFRLKWEIIRQKIIEKEDIQVEDFDLESMVESEAARRKSDPAKIREEFMQNPNITGQILYKKVIDLLLDYSVTHEVEFDEQGHYHPEGEEHHHEHEHDHDHEAHEDNAEEKHDDEEQKKEEESNK